MQTCVLRTLFKLQLTIYLFTFVIHFNFIFLVYCTFIFHGLSACHGKKWSDSNFKHKLKKWHESQSLLNDTQVCISVISVAAFSTAHRPDLCEQSVTRLGRSTLCYSAAEYCAQSGHALLTQVRSMCRWTMRLISGTLLSTPLPWLPVLSNIEPPVHQPYEGRLPLTSWWRKSSNMTVGQSSPISIAHHCYDWHSGSHCGWTCNQLTSKADGGITGSWLTWSILT